MVVYPTKVGPLKKGIPIANRFFNQFGGTLERKVVKLFAKIKYVSGAPTLVTSETLNSGTSPVVINPSQGIESLVVGTGGEFGLVLGANNGGVPSYDTYVRLLDVHGVSVGSATGSLVRLIVTTEDVAGSSGNPSLTVKTYISSGAAVLADGQVLLLEITLSNTTAY